MKIIIEEGDSTGLVSGTYEFDLQRTEISPGLESSRLDARWIRLSGALGKRVEPLGFVLDGRLPTRAEAWEIRRYLDRCHPPELVYAKEDCIGTEPAGFSVEKWVEREDNVECDVCFGTGFESGFGAPCSRGCKS